MRSYPICQYLDEGFSQFDKYIQRLDSWRVENPNVSKRLHIVPWLDSENLRALYHQADVTLCLGTYPEAFGSNVYVESVASGTPCVASMAGAMRITFPTAASFLVLPKDIDSAIEKVKNVLTMTQAQLDAWRARTGTIIRDRYSIDRMRKLYVDAITKADLDVHRAFETPISKDLSSAPWQFLTPDGKRYDDFARDYISSSA